MNGRAVYRRGIVKQRFEAIAPIYDETIASRRAVYTEAVDDLVTEVVGRYPMAAVLDAGCGTGRRWRRLETRVPGVAVTGVDASPAMVARARAGTLERVAVADLTAIPYQDRTFDVVTCLFFVICYLTPARDRRRAMAELYRVLRPGGRLVIDAINRWHRGDGGYRRSGALLVWDYTKSLVDPRLEAGGKLFRTQHRDRPLAGYHHAFSHRSLALLLRSSGFSLERRATIGYGTGLMQARPSRGQIVYVARRPKDGAT